jgi:hypothetical protein
MATLSLADLGLSDKAQHQAFMDFLEQGRQTYRFFPYVKNTVRFYESLAVIRNTLRELIYHPQLSLDATWYYEQVAARTDYPEMVQAIFDIYRKIDQPPAEHFKHALQTLCRLGRIGGIH